MVKYGGANVRFSLPRPNPLSDRRGEGEEAHARSHAPRGHGISRGPASRATKRQLIGVIQLLGAGLIIASAWTIALPHMGSDPSLRESIDRREALGVNADAMFYTELNTMETLVVNWETRKRR